MIQVSLLICTRNRGASLDRTLASVTLAARQFSSIEVVIVDNGSSDDTPSRLAAWRAQQCFPVIVVDEPAGGLARARNAGLACVSGAIVAMTDDDCVLDPGFFVMLVERFTKVPAPVVIGGRILLGNPQDLPITVKLEDHVMEAEADAFPGGFVMGANLAFTHDVVARIGLFDERFGAGARFLAAEDTDFLFRALGAGIPVRYDPYFVVSHHHGRRTPSQFRKLMAGYAYGDGALYAKHWQDKRIWKTLRCDFKLSINDLSPKKAKNISLYQTNYFRLIYVLFGLVVFRLTSTRILIRGNSVGSL